MAWLLLLLAAGESYGRALIGDLADRGIHGEAGLVYRTLRGLEHEGAVTSRWKDSSHGPKRRSYRLTRKGRRMLADFAADITAACERHEMFLRAHANERGTAGVREDVAPYGLGGPSSRPHDADDPGRGGPRVSPDDAAASVVGRELLTAWLLLLLGQRETYGYDLRSTLEDNHIRADPATLYRLLRTLDREGRLQSRWRRPEAGPKRRFYRVTDAGEQHLDALATAIAAIRDSHAAFLYAYHGPPNEPRHRDTAT